MKLKTIDINAKEWFDKVNGNSYFAGTVTINYGMKSEKTFPMPFQYGYGEQYIQEARDILIKEKLVPDLIGYELREYYEKHKIIIRSNIQRGCKKRELQS